MIIKFKKKFLNKKKIYLQIGEIITKSNNSILLKIDNTCILGILVIKNNYNIQDILSLNISYKEKMSSYNKIPYGYIKRKIKYNNREILLMRIIDRLIRPLIKIFFKEIQITLLLLSYNKKFPSEGLIGIITSIILYISKLSQDLFYLIRIIKINNKYIINPSLNILKKKNVKINLLIGGNGKYITVMEGEMKEISYKEFLNIIKYSNKIIIRGILLQIYFLKKYYKYNINKYIKFNFFKNNKKKIKKKINLYKQCIKNIFLQKRSNIFYYKNINMVKNKILKIENFKNSIIFNYYFILIKKKIFNKLIIYKKIRLDNRKLYNIRNINSKVNFLPKLYGSCLFNRGNTQVLTTVTLSNLNNLSIIDTLDIEYKEKFYICYNFNNFSVNEISKNIIISRREIGHGYLAQRSFKYILPNKRKYIIRVVSEVLKSDGSSSMATVCSTSMALLDAGIDIKYNISGLSYGILKYKNKFIILTDISEIEDFYGNIDFKITGTKNGFTSCQIDVKNKILNINIIKIILKKSKIDIIKIINNMNKIINKPKKKYIYKFNIYKKYIYYFNENNILDFKNKNNLSNLIINLCKKKKKIYLISKKIKYIKKFIKNYIYKIFFLKKNNIFKFKIMFINKKGIYIKIYNIFYFLNKKYLYYKYKYIYYFLKKNDYINLIYLNIYKYKIFISRNFL
ncbi:MAG: hypothetical protein ABNO60_00215 [Candidatus Shikimatogenerans sp. Tcar]|uniref:Exoribonuclease phosphorolytic domain-containing protein n=1 Tax=Candidatus Shikimatogenerans sp. Tcar TaxID=3158565 RepID=A0AAU7QSE2_9FLAO